MQKVLELLPMKGWRVDVENLVSVAEIPIWLKVGENVEAYYIIRSNISLDEDRYGVFLNSKTGQVIVARASGLNDAYEFFRKKTEKDAENGSDGR